MKKVIYILLVFFLLGCTTTKYYPRHKEINLFEHNNMLFIQVVLNEKKAFLLLDTGASRSLLDIAQAKKYEFNFLEISTKQYVGIGGLQDVYVVYNYKIKEIFVPFLGMDLTEITQYFNQDDIFIVGIIGSDFLQRFNAKIDFSTHKLYIQ